VSLVAILDADKEGFLRSPRSLIQTIGRAARNVNGRVLMYADKTTKAMTYALSETERRRKLQGDYNVEHGITPESTTRSMHAMTPDLGGSDYVTVPLRTAAEARDASERAEVLRSEMLLAAEQLDFEKAAALRDELVRLEKGIVAQKNDGPKSSAGRAMSSAGRGGQRGGGARKRG
jgi:excinuclease ABC subunit B